MKLECFLVKNFRFKSDNYMCISKSNKIFDEDLIVDQSNRKQIQKQFSC